MSPYKGSILTEMKNCEDESCCQKSTSHPRAFLALAWVFLFFTTLGLCVKVVYLSSQVEEQKRQVELSRKLLQQLLTSHAISDDNLQNVLKSAEFLETASKDGHGLDRDETASSPYQDVNVNIKRSKRSYRSKRPKGPCHLEGKRGPAADPDLDIPHQRPQSTRYPLLWKRPDLQPPSRCNMKKNEGRYGIEYIKITKSGFYYVYAQITYYVPPFTVTGHRVVLKKNATQDGKTLMQAMAPPREMHRDGRTAGPPPGGPARYSADDSRYTGGIFYLTAGDLLGVFPVKPGQMFQMTESRSYFGILYHGTFL